MSLAASRNFSTRTAIAERYDAAEADQDIQGYFQGRPLEGGFGFDYFLSYTLPRGWRKDRSLYVEVPLSDCSQEIIDKVLSLVGSTPFVEYFEPHDMMPNFDDLSSLSIGFAYGANQVNFLLWQGCQYWHINEVLGL